MFLSISEYMRKSREERREHLRLDEPCIEIGGYDSREYRGLLAHFLKTEIPTGHRGKIALCHACHNGKCSNTYHMYWGTYSDNNIDRADHAGRKHPYKPRKPRSELTQIHNERLSYVARADKNKKGWITQVAKELGISHTHVGRLWSKAQKLASRAGIEPA